MGTFIRKDLEFGGGANTTAGEVTSNPVWRSFDDALINRTNSQRRRGKVGIYSFPVVATMCDFDGADDKITIPFDARIFPLKTRFTVKTLFTVDSISSTRYILGQDTATGVGLTIRQTSTSTVVVVVEDSAGSTTTLTWTGIAAGTTCALQVARDGTTLTGYLNGTVQSGTMSSATNTLKTSGAFALGVSNGANWLDGGIDHLTVLSTYETSQVDGWLRHMNPRADNVIADWPVTLTSDGYCLDRGRYEVHGTSAGTPSTRALLAHNPDPIRAVALNLNTSGVRQGYVVAGDRVYPVSM